MAEGALLPDVIDRICEAESAAEDEVRRARAESRQLVAEARQSYESMLDAMRKEVRAAERDLLEKAKTSAEDETGDIRKEGRAAVDEVKQSADDRIEAAIGAVLDSISAAAS